jgi:hypothetical protein
MCGDIMRTDVVTQIRRCHEQVLDADKCIDEAGKQQIRAAFKCGQLLAQEHDKCRSGGWGKWCDKHIPEISTSTIGRYISLSKSSDLTKLIQKYRTLNSAYVGEGIVPAPRQRITIKPIVPTSSDSKAVAIVAQHNGSKSVAPHNGDGADSINLKAKLKGGGNLGDLLGKVSPVARAAIESQLRGSADGGQVQSSPSPSPAPEGNGGCNSTLDGHSKSDELAIDASGMGVEEIARLFPGSLLVEALLLQLQRSIEKNDAAKIVACASSLRPLVEWHAQHAPKAELALAA